MKRAVPGLPGWQAEFREARGSVTVSRPNPERSRLIIRTVRQAHTLLAISTALVLLWCAAVWWIALNQAGDNTLRPLMYVTMVGTGALAVPLAVAFGNALFQGITLSAAGGLIAVAGVVGAATVGLPIVPIGVAYLTAGLVVGEGTAAARRSFARCAVAAGLGAIVPSALVMTQ